MGIEKNPPRGSVELIPQLWCQVVIFLCGNQCNNQFPCNESYSKEIAIGRKFVN
jgi:hypothetical protein